MKNCTAVSALVGALLLTAFSIYPLMAVSRTSSADTSLAGGRLPANTVELHILLDNVTITERMTPGWGFACLVKAADKTLLMDAGPDGDQLMSNMAAGNVNLKDIDAVPISHCHADHIGGLPTVIRNIGADTKLYLPGDAVPGKLGGRALAIVDSARSTVRDVVYVHTPGSICTGVMTTGLPDDAFPEQSLIIQTEEGAVVITGCAHPGIVQIVRRAAELTGQPILLVIGGFHLVSESQDAIDRLAEELHGLTNYIASCHCSGDLARERFRNRFRDRYLEVGTGSVIKIADLSTENQH